jgi:hypothetical protein
MCNEFLIRRNRNQKIGPRSEVIDAPTMATFLLHAKPVKPPSLWHAVKAATTTSKADYLNRLFSDRPPRPRVPLVFFVDTEFYIRPGTFARLVEVAIYDQ